jgi:hypothetical protein
MTDYEESLLRKLIGEKESLLASALQNPHALRSKIDKLRENIEAMRKQLPR